jgi:glycosyltransferase involved in cell wall biosynthesis
MKSTNVINLIQDIATPHNNILISKFKNRDDVKLNIWYAIESNQNMYQWKNDLTNEHFRAIIYKKNINFNFLLYCLKNRHEKFIIVGWMNINTKILHMLFFLLRRKYNHWTDLPDNTPKNIYYTIKKYFMYWVLKNSNAKIFCVGKSAINYFKNLGFESNRLVNLPIFVNTNKDLNYYLKQKDFIYKQLSIKTTDFLISAGSRLVHTKGYDLLIDAISSLESRLKNVIKLVIVGSGDSLEYLKNKTIELNLINQIIFKEWMEFEDFEFLIANSKIFIHPARFDSYGGTIFAMSLGVPVIGSFQAGAAADRIVNGVNGYLYDAYDVQKLSNLINNLYNNPELIKTFGENAFATSKEWPPEKGVEIILNNSIL